MFGHLNNFPLRHISFSKNSRSLVKTQLCGDNFPHQWMFHFSCIYVFFLSSNFTICLLGNDIINVKYGISFSPSTSFPRSSMAFFSYNGFLRNRSFDSHSFHSCNCTIWMEESDQSIGYAILFCGSFITVDWSYLFC